MAAIRDLAPRSGRIGSLLVLLVGINPVSGAGVLGVRAMEGIAATEKTGHRYRAPSVDERVEALSRSLNLSEPQKSAVRTILEHRLKELKEARSLSSNDRRTIVDQIRAVEEKTVERICATLNEEQRRKYEPLGVRSSASRGGKSVEAWLKEMGPR